jgi:hypothetical protein
MVEHLPTKHAEALCSNPSTKEKKDDLSGWLSEQQPQKNHTPLTKQGPEDRVVPEMAAEKPTGTKRARIRSNT